LRFLGPSLFDNNWSFSHWRFLPFWYGPAWILLLAAAAHITHRFPNWESSLLSKRWFIGGSIAALAALLLIFRFDSFLYGSGDLRIAQIAQADRIIFRWYELGAVAITTLFFKLYQTVGLAANDAGVAAWRTLSYAGAALTIAAAFHLAKELGDTASKRVMLFIFCFFGGQLLVLFGYTGIEPLVVAVVTWFGLYTVRFSSYHKLMDLGVLWVIMLAGILLHASLTFLLPAAVFLTLAGRKAPSTWRSPAFAGGLMTIIVLLIAVYVYGGRSLEFSGSILFPTGKSPNTDYGLFSARHIGDILQLIFMISPLVIVAAVAAFVISQDSRMSNARTAAWLMFISGLAVAFIFDPPDSIVLDLPRLAAYLSPAALVVALYLAPVSLTDRGRRWLATGVTALSLVVPVAYLPNYIWIRQSEQYVSDYLDRHDIFYRTACTSYRDSYFYRKEIDDANQWEWKLPVKSPDVLNFRGTIALSVTGDNPEALNVLHRIIAKNPYWTEPRATIARILLNRGQYVLAKPEIDTCLLLEPYVKTHHVLLYQYYRYLQDYPHALAAVRRAMYLFPKDREIVTDNMIVNYRAGEMTVAEAAADSLLSVDANLPFPNLIKGLILDRQGKTGDAIRYYESFVTLAPKEPEAATVKSRLEKLKNPSSGR
ncbi:MAG TPA: hypothetical protein VMS71_03760, partial [Candidatus Acidoferrum sp.]|nr:hypothetical protein [Candidatus Acidoferrum sp.]